MDEQTRISTRKVEQGQNKAHHTKRKRTEAGKARHRESQKVAAMKRREAYVSPEPVLGARWIPLSRGMFALVDESDYDFLSQFTWSVCGGTRNKYAEFRKHVDGKMKTFSMHRLLLQAPANMQVDHRNGNGLDCRRSNLRLCSATQNRKSLRKQLRATASRFKGVCWDKIARKWTARIRPNRTEIFLGRFDTEVAAGVAYNQAAVKHFGDYALLNTIPPNAPC